MAEKDFIAGIRGIIFDYGGTIDSRGVHWSIIIDKAYRNAGIALDPGAFRDAYIYAERELARHPHIRPEHNFLDLMRIKIRIELQRLFEEGVLDAATVRNINEPVARYCYDFARECADEARPVIETLSGRYPLVLVSNFYGNISSVLADFDLLRFFPTIVESSVVGVRKPDPRIFTLGIEALGMAAEDVLVVGDSIGKDLIPAASLGCRTAWVNGPGWDDGGKTPLSPPEGAAKLASLSDLLHLLK